MSLALSWEFSKIGHDLKVLGDLFKGFQRCPLTIVQRRDGVLQAMIDVILDECSFGLADRFLNRMKLLSDIHALTPFFDHGDDAAQMTVRSLEALDDRLVTLVGMGMAVFVFLLTHDLRPGLR
ncbi:hypothetical protein M2426_003060 [Pseudomonas moraviensis]